MRPFHTALLVCAALVPVPAAAQKAAARPIPPGPAQTAPSAAIPPKEAAPAIDLPKALILIRAHLAALQAADQTGDYRVLYEMGSHDFQIANPPDKLAAIFAHLKAYNLNAVLLDTPAFYQPPFIDQAGRLNMKGYFLKDGFRVDFLLIFQSEMGTWKLFGIGANVAPAGAKAP
jgi:hypothetical protein